MSDDYRTGSQLARIHELEDELRAVRSERDMLIFRADRRARWVRWRGKILVAAGVLSGAGIMAACGMPLTLLLTIYSTIAALTVTIFGIAIWSADA